MKFRDELCQTDPLDGLKNRMKKASKAGYSFIELEYAAFKDVERLKRWCNEEGIRLDTQHPCHFYPVGYIRLAWR